MQFSPIHCALIRAGTKTETRRPFTDSHEFNGLAVLRVNTAGRETLLYRVGDDYALQPGRGKPAIEGVRLLVTHLRVEQLHDITDAGVNAEGWYDLESFRNVWAELYPRGQFAWDKNPRVFVVRFKLVKE